MSIPLGLALSVSCTSVAGLPPYRGPLPPPRIQGPSMLGLMAVPSLLSRHHPGSPMAGSDTRELALAAEPSVSHQTRICFYHQSGDSMRVGPAHLHHPDQGFCQPSGCLLLQADIHWSRTLLSFSLCPDATQVRQGSCRCGPLLGRWSRRLGLRMGRARLQGMVPGPGADRQSAGLHQWDTALSVPILVGQCSCCTGC